MNAEITKDKDDNNIPYVELKLSPDEEDELHFYITFRRYPRRIFVAVENYGDEPAGFSGADIEDCFIAPVMIIEKTIHAEFEPHRSFLNALRHIGQLENEGRENPFTLECWEQDYQDVKNIIDEWMKS